jgi:hypothetical protein
MPQIISAAIACVVLGLAGWQWYFTGTGNTSPAGHEFGTGLMWLTLLLYVIGFAAWVIGLPVLLVDPRRYRIILQLASAIVYVWPVVTLVMGEFNDRHLRTHVRAEYTVEWKCPAAWQEVDFHGEVDAPGGTGGCEVKRHAVADGVLKMSGGPIFVQSERQIIRLYSLTKGQDIYLFCVDLHDMNQPGQVSDWIVARSSKFASPDAFADANKRFFRYGDPGGYSPVEDPVVMMRYKILSIERQRGRFGQ